jgi:arginase
MATSLTILGVPTSAGAFAPGQELAPAALRRAGLIERLGEAGIEVADLGDSPAWRWRPDPSRPRAQNARAVGQIARETASRVERALAGGAPLLVLGGDCTIELGTLAGHLAAGVDVGLVYFDLHPDLNTPASVHAGALDWMGMAHALGVEGTDPELAEIGPRSPLLEPEQVVFLGYGPQQARPFELELMERLGVQAVPVDEVARAPESAAVAALETLGSRHERLLVHFDVDTIDFNDAPLSENTGRGEGVALATAMRALRVLLASPRLSAATVSELNPLHGDEEGRTLERFIDGLCGCLAP